MTTVGVEPKFIVLSLPRSRSAWISHFLRYAGLEVGHDVSTRCSSVAEFKLELEPLAGTVETGAVLGWRVLREEFPSAKLAVVKRDPREVWNSMLKFGIELDQDDLVLKWELLGVVSRLPGVLSIEYSSLSSAEACASLFEHCLDLPFDWGWWAEMSSINIQVNMERRLSEIVLNRGRTESLKAEVASRTAAMGVYHPWLN